MKHTGFLFSCALLALSAPSSAYALDDVQEQKETAAENPTTTQNIPAHHQYSGMVTGTIGLNNVPSARMSPAGTFSVGFGNIDPYFHGFLGFQLAAPVYVALRQSAEETDINDTDNTPYPGMDLKFRLLKENSYQPEIAIGMQSAIGHKRMAGEYIALSKRYNNFDFTFGLGWGRFGSTGHITNPLKDIHPHFGNDRLLDGDEASKPSDWFTGSDAGFFGGVEYFTPIDGLSLKLDYGADEYAIEKTLDPSFKAPSPWSAGLSYHLTPQLNLSAAAQGNDKVMGRLTFKSPLSSWPYGRKKPENPTLLKTERNTLTQTNDMIASAEKEGIYIAPVEHGEGRHISSALEMDPLRTAPYQIGRAAVHIANGAAQDIQTINIHPTLYGLHGPNITLLRSDLENALLSQQGSPQEIWHNTTFKQATAHKPDKEQAERKQAFMPPLQHLKGGAVSLHAYIDDALSLTEEDSGFFYRTSLILEAKTPILARFLSPHISGGISWRFNLDDNLDELFLIRPAAHNDERTRSDLASFAEKDSALDRLWLGYNHNIASDIYAGLRAGYLEEQYAGFGGEVLYRPFGKRFALGAEAWKAYKRDPDSNQILGITGNDRFSSFANLWYDIPAWDTTFQAKAGRFLGEDFGSSLALEREFDNGVRLKGFVTLTDQTDTSLLGGDTNAYHGIVLTMPLWQSDHKRHGASLRSNLTPLARDSGQVLDTPYPLYELTTPFSKDHLARYWNEIAE